MMPFFFNENYIPITNANIIGDGNSLMFGQAGNVGGKSLPTLLSEYSTAHNLNWIVVNEGTNGARLTDMITQYNTYIKPKKSNTKRNIIFLWEGTNDAYALLTPQQCYDNYVTYTNQAKADGWEVAWFTTLPRNQALPDGNTIEEYNNRLNQINNLLKSNKNLADWFFDVRLATELAIVNPTHYGDAIHLNQLGYEVLLNKIILKHFKD